ncbi:hypothetical protein [Nitrospira sp. Nam74]
MTDRIKPASTNLIAQAEELLGSSNATMAECPLLQSLFPRCNLVNRFDLDPQMIYRADLAD